MNSRRQSYRRNYAEHRPEEHDDGGVAVRVKRKGRERKRDLTAREEISLDEMGNKNNAKKGSALPRGKGKKGSQKRKGRKEKEKISCAQNEKGSAGRAWKD